MFDVCGVDMLSVRCVCVVCVMRVCCGCVRYSVCG